MKEIISNKAMQTNATSKGIRFSFFLLTIHFEIVSFVFREVSLPDSLEADSTQALTVLNLS